METALTLISFALFIAVAIISFFITTIQAFVYGVKTRLKAASLKSVYVKETEPSERPIIVKITNRANEVHKSILFGRNKHLITPNYGSDIAVSNEVIGSSYIQMLNESESFVSIDKLLFVCKKDTASKLHIVKRTADAFGQKSWSPHELEMDFVKALDHKRNVGLEVLDNEIMRFDSEIDFKINNNSWLELEVPANSELTVYIDYTKVKYTPVSLYDLFSEIMGKILFFKITE
jgi:hypothetical protein